MKLFRAPDKGRFCIFDAWKMSKIAFHSDLMRRENTLKILLDALFVKRMGQQKPCFLKLELR